MKLPKIIQGGMGVGISNWFLARTVALLSYLGVVSGVALETLLVRRLQLGDKGGHIRRALNAFPFKEMAERVRNKYYIPGGKSPEDGYKLLPYYTIDPAEEFVQLIVIANFVEVWLASEGHNGLIGINYLEKIQFPTLPALYGAMLAGVRFVLMGAGIPRSIPGVLDDLAQGKAVKLKIDVENAGPKNEFYCEFDPQRFCRGNAPALIRPWFIAIISLDVLALTLARKATGRVNGFIVEGVTAGGHNAPPREMVLSNRGEPVYGPRDIPNLDKIKALGLPFWLAGSFGEPGKLKEALNHGATGVQVGTAFAFCKESGLDPEIKRHVIEESSAGNIDVFTDPIASPTGFPFKVVRIKGTMSDDEVYANCERKCEFGVLRKAYLKNDGTIGYRCPSEPVNDYLKKGGKIEDAARRKCICRVLVEDTGFGAHGRSGMMLTAGDCLMDKDFLPQFSRGRNFYYAKDVTEAVLDGCE